MSKESIMASLERRFTPPRSSDPAAILVTTHDEMHMGEGDNPVIIDRMWAGWLMAVMDPKDDGDLQYIVQVKKSVSRGVVNVPISKSRIIDIQEEPHGFPSKPRRER